MIALPQVGFGAQTARFFNGVEGGGGFLNSFLPSAKSECYIGGDTWAMASPGRKLCVTEHLLYAGTFNREIEGPA
jgi:hypothetical protein